MNTVLKFDEVILVRKLNDKFNKTGEHYEVANISEDSLLLKDAKTKVVVGVISFADFENHFVHKENFKGWTSWENLVGFDGQTDIEYRTNGKKTQVRFLTNKIRAEACCDNRDEFNLTFGIHMAYLRCLNKAFKIKKNELEEQLKKINSEIAENEMVLKKMRNSIAN